MEEIIREWWAIFLAGIGLIVWLVRLEGKMILGNRELETHKKTCIDRHALDTEDTREFKKSMDKLFDLVREVREDVREIKGWKDGMQK